MALQFLNDGYFAGKVGIGTDSPSAKLDIINSGLSTMFRLSNTETNATTKYGAILGRHYTNTEENVTGILITSSSSATGGAVSIGGGITTANAVNNVIFYTAANNTTLTGSERMRIDSSGDVGIGTASPAAKLDVNGTFRANTFVSIQGTDTGNPAAALDELRVSGYGIQGNRGSVYITNAATTGNIRFGIGGAHASNNKMIIEAGGNVGIGVTGPQSKLQVAGGIQMADDTDYSFSC